MSYLLISSTNPKICIHHGNDGICVACFMILSTRTHYSAKPSTRGPIVFDNFPKPLQSLYGENLTTERKARLFYEIPYIINYIHPADYSRRFGNRNHVGGGGGGGGCGGGGGGSGRYVICILGRYSDKGGRPGIEYIGTGG